ncbi:MAG: GNAT family protein [Pseudomonadota bacterium]
MIRPFLIGENVYLRGLERHGIDSNYFQWFNDSEVTQNMMHGAFPMDLEAFQEYYEQMTRSKNDVVIEIVTIEGDVHIGNCALHKINPIHRFTEIGLIIGEKEYWGKGHAKEAFILIHRHGFDHLNINKVFGTAHELNVASIRALQRIGYEVEGRLRGEIYEYGRYLDRIYIGITRDDFYRIHGGGPDGSPSKGVRGQREDHEYTNYELRPEVKNLVASQQID